MQELLVTPRELTNEVRELADNTFKLFHRMLGDSAERRLISFFGTDFKSAQSVTKLHKKILTHFTK